MEVFLIFLLFALGVVLIVKGGDLFVDAASFIATATGIPKFIIGATVVSFATTAPELIVSIMATRRGEVEMAVGNAVGSVTANIGLIFAISLLFLPSIIKRKTVAAKGILMVLSGLVLWLACFGGGLALLPSVALMGLFLLFLWENIRSSKNEISQQENKESRFDKRTVFVNIVKFVLGAAFIIAGASLLVDNGKKIALLFGVSESIIGLTLVAVGTSLPELVTTVTAIVKKQSSLSVGNIIGANIIDITMILPVCSFVYGGALPVKESAVFVQLPVMVLLLLISVIPTLIAGKFSRWQGVFLLTIYCVYIAAVWFLL